MCVCVQSLSCATPTDYSPPGSSVHGIFLARVLKWVAISSSRQSSPTRGGNPHLQHLLRWQADALPLSHLSESCSVVCNSLQLHGLSATRLLSRQSIEFFRQEYWSGLPSRPRDQTRVSRIAGRCFTIWAAREDSQQWLQTISTEELTTSTHCRLFPVRFRFAYGHSGLRLLWPGP